MSPILDCSMSTSFLSTLRGNCPCILFPVHLSFVFSALLSLIFLLSLCISVFRHLAVCNTAQSVLCWCVLTTCISGSSFLSTYSTSFVVSTVGLFLTASDPFLPVIIIIIIIIITTFRQGFYNYRPETHHDSWVHVQCCSCSLFTVYATCNVISNIKYVLYLYISTSRCMCASVAYLGILFRGGFNKFS